MRTTIRPLAALLACGLLLASVASAHADTATYLDAADRKGPHDIVRVVVDNDGPQVSVTVRHAAGDWVGDDLVRWDVAGGPRAEFTSLIHRGRGVDRHSQADGARWRCGERQVLAGPHRRTTVEQVPRRCLDGAEHVRVYVTASMPRRLSDRAHTGVVPQQTRPNVIVIMVDDMRDDDLQWMPQTERLIGDQGVRFANSFAPYPLCCPARSSFLTGEYTHNHHVWSHKEPWGFHALDDRSTLATWLHQAGYATIFLGKYLNGYGHQPPHDDSATSSVHYVPPGWTDWRGAIDGGLPANDPLSGGTYRYFDTTLNVNGRLQGHQGRYQTRLYGSITRAIIEHRAPKPQPFFMWLSFTAPHHGAPHEADDPEPITRDDGKITKVVTPARPADVRGTFDSRITKPPGMTSLSEDTACTELTLAGSECQGQEADVSDKPFFIRNLPLTNDAEWSGILTAARQRAEAESVVDDQVATIVRTLRDQGALDDTYLFFTSDNGYFLGEHRIRQGKILPYEPSLRTPLLVRGPGIPAGQVRYDPFLTIDFAPTISRIAGAIPGIPVDGRSMLGVAAHGDRAWDRPVITETGPRQSIADVTEAGTPLVTTGDNADECSAPDGDCRFSLGLRTDRFLYVRHQSGEHELYDLYADPNELYSVYDDPAYADMRDELATELEAVKNCVGEACRQPLPADLATEADQIRSGR